MGDVKESVVVWDLGPVGLLALGVMALAFGAFTQLVLGRQYGWWPVVLGTAGFLLVGIVVSEGLFGWATEEDLQPNIDGLSFDEVLLAFVVCAAIVLAIRFVTRRTSHPPLAH